MVTDRGGTTIAVRERSVPEVYDLALLVWRRHGAALALLAAVGCLPWALLDWWLVAGGGDEDWWRWWLLLVLAAAQSPLATAPLTAYLGAALFDGGARPGAALRTAAGLWRPLLLAGLVRGLLTVLPLLALLWPPYAVEVLVLERLRGGAARRRAAALRSVQGGDQALHHLAALAVLAALLWMVVGGWRAARGVLMHADPWLDWAWYDLLPGLSPAPHLALWLSLAFLASVRFLAYIDLRTRHEGWELGLVLRRAAARVGERR